MKKQKNRDSSKGLSLLTLVFVIIVVTICVIAFLSFLELLGVDENTPQQVTPDWWGL